MLPSYDRDRIQILELVVRKELRRPGRFTKVHPDTIQGIVGWRAERSFRSRKIVSMPQVTCLECVQNCRTKRVIPG